MLIKNGFMKNKNRIALIIPYFTSTPPNMVKPKLLFLF